MSNYFSTVNSKTEMYRSARFSVHKEGVYIKMEISRTHVTNKSVQASCTYTVDSI